MLLPRHNVRHDDLSTADGGRLALASAVPKSTLIDRGYREAEVQDSVPRDQSECPTTRSSGSRGPTLIVPVETPGLEDLHDLTLLTSLDRARVRAAVHVERLMATPPVIMAEVR